MGAYLIDQGIALNPNNGDGPDFSFDIAGRRVWVEAISPGPGDGNNRVPDNRPSTPNVVEVFDAPVIPVLLRHTAAIDEKFRKYQRYRERGVVGPSDPFLIAVDSSQLGLSGFEGGSGFPAALEAVYPLGAMQVHFAVGSPEQTRTDHQYRPAVQNANSANVQTTRFLDEAYAGISGIIAADRCDVYLLNYPIRPVVLVHNKVATNPIPEGQLKVDFEYHIEEQAGGYTIRRTGR